MSASAESNFAARLVERLGASAQLVDAATLAVIDSPALGSAVRRFAAAFAGAGLRYGDRVLIGCSLGPQSSLAYLGAMFGGFVPLPVNESALESSGEVLCAKSGARALWTEQPLHCKWAQRAQLVQLCGLQTEISTLAAPARCCEDDLAALMSTSGSTGEPRLVKVTHGNLIANTEAIIRSQNLGAEERAMLILPVSYCFGASVLHTHLYTGGSVVFDSRFMFPDKVLRAIDLHRCTTFAGVPAVYNILLRRSNLAKIALPSLRRFLQAGGALARESVERMRAIVPHAEFFVMYGQTEATSRISCLPPNRLAEKLGSVGIPLDNLRVRILDTNGVEVPAGQSGELWVSGKSICPGYLDEPRETHLKFRDGWLATGDIASRDDDGFLWITGRKSEFIKMRGVRVSFAEIETRVQAVPGVSECAAMALPHAEAGEAVALYVVSTVSAEEVSASIRRCLPTEWVCDSLRFVTELPRNAYGKLARSRLAETTYTSCPVHPTEASRAPPAKPREPVRA